MRQQPEQQQQQSSSSFHDRHITAQHLEFWHQLVKRDDGHKKFHLPMVLFYIFDLIVFGINIGAHASNKAYDALGFTIAIQLISAWIISLFYKLNEDSIDEHNVIFDGRDPKSRTWKCFRLICQLLTITPLFRVIANWKDHERNHDFVRQQRILRKQLSREEVRAIILNKKRQCIKSYFGTLQAYFKTIPQWILQIYIGVGTNLPLRFCTLTDVTRIITLGWTVIAASAATAWLYFSVLDYLKALHFQDYLLYNCPVQLAPLTTHTKWVTFVWNFFGIGSRLYAISYLLSYGNIYWIFALLTVVFLANVIWTHNTSHNRPFFENPLSDGQYSTFCSNLVDRYTNIFCFHMIRLNCKNAAIHQLLFIIPYSLIGSMLIFQEVGLDWLQNNWSTVFVNAQQALLHQFHANCNFTIFTDSLNGFARILHEILNSNGEARANFKDLLSSEVALMAGFFLAALLSILYTTMYKWLAQLEELAYPLQYSVKHWKAILGKNWTEVGPAHALKVLVLGIADTSVLDFWKYKLPEKETELKELLASYVSAIELIKTDSDKDSIILPCVLLETTEKISNNSIAIAVDSHCSELIQLFSQYLLNQQLNEETVIALAHFTHSFSFYMKQMSSYRIAQTYSVLKIS